MIKKLLKNDVVKQFRDFGIGPIIGMFISMLTVPVTTRLVLPEEFGKSSLFTLVQTIFLIAAVFGLDQAFVRYYNSKEFSKEAVLYNSFTLPLLLTIILGLVSLVFMKPISIWLYGSYEKELMLLFPPFLLALLFNRYAYLILRMELRGKLYSLLNIIAQLIGFLFLLTLLLFYERTFRSIVIASIFSMIINTCVALIITRKSWVFKKKYYNKELTKKMLFFALPLVPATLISWILNSFDKVALKEWSSYEELGLYAAAFKIVALLAVFQTIFSTSWIPLLFKWYEEDINDNNFKRVNTLTISFAIILAFVIIIFRNPVFLILGPKYRNTAGVFVYLLIVPVLNIISVTCTNGMDLNNKTYLSLISTSIGAICNIFLNYLFIPYLGAKGAAIATSISFFAYFTIQYFMSRKLWIKFDLKHLIINLLFLTTLMLAIEFEFSIIIELILFGLMVLYNFKVCKCNILYNNTKIKSLN